MLQRLPKVTPVVAEVVVEVGDAGRLVGPLPSLPPLFRRGSGLGGNRELGRGVGVGTGDQGRTGDHRLVFRRKVPWGR